MQLVALRYFHSRLQNALDLLRKWFSRIAAIHQYILHFRQSLLLLNRKPYRSGSIRHIGRRYLDAMRQALRIDGDMTLDPGYFLAAVIPFLLRRIRVLHALCVQNAKRGFFFPPKVGSDLSNYFFLAPGPKHFLVHFPPHSISESRHGQFSTSESPMESFSTDIRS